MLSNECTQHSSLPHKQQKDSFCSNSSSTSIYIFRVLYVAAIIQWNSPLLCFLFGSSPRPNEMERKHGPDWCFILIWAGFRHSLCTDIKLHKLIALHRLIQWGFPSLLFVCHHLSQCMCLVIHIQLLLGAFLRGLEGRRGQEWALSKLADTSTLPRLLTEPLLISPQYWSRYFMIMFSGCYFPPDSFFTTQFNSSSSCCCFLGSLSSRLLVQRWLIPSPIELIWFHSVWQDLLTLRGLWAGPVFTTCHSIRSVSQSVSHCLVLPLSIPLVLVPVLLLF